MARGLLAASVLLGLLFVLFALAAFGSDTDAELLEYLVGAVLSAGLGAAGWGLRRRRRPPVAPRPPHVGGQVLDVLTPSRRRWGAYLGLSFGFVAVGLALALTTAPGAWSVVVVFGALSLVPLRMLLPGQTFLLLTAEGIVAKGPGRTRSYRWDEVRDVRVVTTTTRYRTLRFVGFDMVGPARQTWRQRLDELFVGCDATLPDDYGQGHQVLADRLSALQSDALRDGT